MNDDCLGAACSKGGGTGNDRAMRNSTKRSVCKLGLMPAVPAVLSSHGISGSLDHQKEHLSGRNSIITLLTAPYTG